ncbi:MAG: hypothetical protein JWL58_2832 [Streptosporangiaceae bacterium]|jgi:hypothetical protein|nr:hypothetical protein [Streptosporangiaceae bacterium]
MTRRALLAAGTLTAAVLLSGCGGAGHQAAPPPANTSTGTTGTGLSDQEISDMEKIVSGAESAAEQAAAAPG